MLNPFIIDKLVLKYMRKKNGIVFGRFLVLDDFYLGFSLLYRKAS